MHAQLSESWLAVLLPPLVSHQALQSLLTRLSSEGHCKHLAWLRSTLLGSKIRNFQAICGRMEGIVTGDIAAAACRESTCQEEVWTWSAIAHALLAVLHGDQAER